MRSRGRFGQCCVCGKRGAPEQIIVETDDGTKTFRVCDHLCAYTLGRMSLMGAVTEPRAELGSA
jgi:hypothetical protein